MNASLKFSPKRVVVNRKSSKVYYILGTDQGLTLIVRVTDGQTYAIDGETATVKYRRPRPTEVVFASQHFGRYKEIVGTAKAAAKKQRSAVKQESGLITMITPSALDDVNLLIVTDTVRVELMKCANAILNGDKIRRRWRLDELVGPRMNGINFWGPPGCGKTKAASALARLVDREVALVNSAKLHSSLVSGTGRNIDTLFDELATLGDRVVVFFDEADDLLLDRERSGPYASIINQDRVSLMAALDRYKGWVIFATNIFSNYDPAFTRRISRHVEFARPTAPLRRQLWKLYARADDLDYETLAGASDGLSGANILTVCLNAIETASLNPNEAEWKLTTRLLLNEVERMPQG